MSRGGSGYRDGRTLARRRGTDRALLALFQRFLRDLKKAEATAVAPLAGVQAAGARMPGGAPDAAGESTALGEQPSVEAVRGILVSAVERFSRDTVAVLPAGGGDPARQATQAVVAFADERLLAFSWPGRTAWLDRPLELQLFGTRNGGEEVYRRIDALTGGSEAQKALALLYLSILNLGFRGRYDPERESDAAGLESYRARLFRMIAGREADIEEAGAALNDTESPPQKGGETRYLPYVRPWITVLAALVVVFFAASHLLWLGHTSALAVKLEEITAEMGF